MTVEKIRARWNRANGRWQEFSEKWGWAPYFLQACPVCNGPWLRGSSAAMCNPCSRRAREKVIAITRVGHAAVAKAKKDGTLPELDGSVPCVDCGAPARDYDHRNYDNPLDVVPVCRRCNIRRGPAPALTSMTLRAVSASHKAKAVSAASSASDAT